jgi:hypothetical protein
MTDVVKVRGYGPPDPLWISHNTIIGPKRLVSRDEV